MSSDFQCTVRRDLGYGAGASASKQRQLDLYTLSSSSGEAVNRPLLVFVHGGLWVDRDKSDYETLGAHWCRTIGAHVAVVNYRQSRKGGTGVLHPAHTDDTIAAIEWIMRPETQKAHGFSSSDLFIIGHSCGAHIAGLIALAEPPATLLTELVPLLQGANAVNSVTAAAASSSPVAPLQPSSPLSSYLRGCVGVEGIFDCALFARDFPDWSSGVTDAFGPDAQYWESPQDYLPLADPKAKEEEDSSASRNRVQGLLSAGTSTRMSVPWLVIHSPEDPWVNLPQAERFHAAVNASVPSSAASTSSTSSTSTSQIAITAISSSSPNLPASRLLLVSGAHFEVVNQVGTLRDEITHPIRDFVRQVMAQQKQAQ